MIKVKTKKKKVMNKIMKRGMKITIVKRTPPRKRKIIQKGMIMKMEIKKMKKAQKERKKKKHQ